MTHTVKFISHGRKAKCAPNPKYPDGMDVDTGVRPACKVELPYPAECCGVILVVCDECRSNAIITTAGRPDDPKSYMLPCKRRVH